LDAEFFFAGMLLAGDCKHFLPHVQRQSTFLCCQCRCLVAGSAAVGGTRGNGGACGHACKSQSPVACAWDLSRRQCQSRIESGAAGAAHTGSKQRIPRCPPCAHQGAPPVATSSLIVGTSGRELQHCSPPPVGRTSTTGLAAGQACCVWLGGLQRRAARWCWNGRGSQSQLGSGATKWYADANKQQMAVCNCHTNANTNSCGLLHCLLDA
jgi:hypothetical protein